MKRITLLTALVITAVVLTTVALMSAPLPSLARSTAWFWTGPKPLSKVFLGDFDNQMVVVEGQIGNKVDPAEWNIYLFGDGGDFDIRANFADNMPDSVLPKNTTVRLIGVPKDGEMAVEGLEIMGSSSAQPDATIGQINGGSLDGQEVAVRGQVGNQIDAEWKYYQFSDATGTAVVDFEDNLPQAQTPKDRSIIVYGEVKNDGGTRRVDNDTMLITSGGGTEPTATATMPAPTSTATAPAPTSTATAPAPTATPNPDADEFAYMPIVLKPDGTTTPPTATPQPIVSPTPPADDWIWVTTTSAVNINSGCCRNEVEVLNGMIVELTNPAWNEYRFSDESAAGAIGSLTLDFEDTIPAAAIPLNTAVRVIGKVVFNNSLKFDVYGLQTLGSVNVQPNATAAQVNSGSLEDQDVVLKGMFGNRVGDAPSPDWNWYAFTDGSGSTIADLENDLLSADIPQNQKLILFGEVDDYFGDWKVDSDLMLFAANVN